MPFTNKNPHSKKLTDLILIKNLKITLTII